MSIRGCKPVFLKSSYPPGVEKGTSLEWVMQNFSTFMEKKALQTFDKQISHLIIQRTCFWQWAKSNPLVITIKLWTDPVWKWNKMEFILPKNQTEIPFQNPAIPSSLPYICLFSVPEKNLSNAIRNSAYISKVSDCLVMMYRKDLKDREREVPGTSVQKEIVTCSLLLSIKTCNSNSTVLLEFFWLWSRAAQVTFHL